MKNLKSIIIIKNQIAKIILDLYFKTVAIKLLHITYAYVKYAQYTCIHKHIHTSISLIRLIFFILFYNHFSGISQIYFYDNKY